MEKATASKPVSSGQILLVDDTPENLRLLMAMLKDAGFSVATAINGAMALKAVASIHPDLILLDIIMPDMDGYTVCQRLKSQPQTADIPVLFISALDTQIDKLKAFSAGGLDYICKPFSTEEVMARVQTHIKLRQSLLTVQKQKRELEQEKAERVRAEQERNKYQQQIVGLLTKQLMNPEAFASIHTQNEKMQRLFHYVDALSCSSEPVLIMGESGVGKELFAKALHNVCCPDRPWVAVNVAGLDDNVFSDTLFGHSKGAFTGADKDRSGMVEKAKGGALFLDEIGDLSPTSQLKLLRLLQEKEYLPLGSDDPRHADCRVVVATNADLKQKMDRGEFRQDLYYRLATHCLEIPPLRERKDDIPYLLDLFLQEAAEELNKEKPTYPAELPVLLGNYDYPGNVRQLRSMVYDALSQHSSRMLSMAVFEQNLGLHQSGPATSDPSQNDEKITFPSRLPTLKENTARLIKEALQRTAGNQSMAAKLLGITASALNMRLKKMSDSEQH